MTNKGFLRGRPQSDEEHSYARHRVHIQLFCGSCVDWPSVGCKADFISCSADNYLYDRSSTRRLPNVASGLRGCHFLRGFHYFQGCFHGEAPLGDGYRAQPGYARESASPYTSGLSPGTVEKGFPDYNRRHHLKAQRNGVLPSLGGPPHFRLGEFRISGLQYALENYALFF